MALSGRILGAFNGSIANTSYSRPVIEWSATQNISGNYSTVTASLVFERYHGTYNRSFNNSGHSVALTINGNRSTASRTFNIRDNTRSVVWTRTVRVNHNSNGSKSFSLSASGNTGVSLGSYNFSGTGALNAIPRASTLSAFSFASHLQPSTAVNLNYTIDRKSGSFRHQIQLRDGSHVVQTWDNVSSNGSTSVKLSTASVNSLLNRMSSVTTRSLTLRVATRSGVGGGWIGSAVTRNATATVSATVKPTVSAVSVSQTGNTVSSHYLQSKSRVKASFTRSGGYGASISSSSITVRRKSGGADSQTISGPSGTTGRAVNLSGTYEARGMARDSRGRTTYTAWKEFAVTAYSGPRITNFTAVRSSSAETTVSISRAGTHTPLGGSNVLTYTVQRRIGTGAWTNVNTNPTGTSKTASFSGTSTSTGNSVTTSYDFRMVITDKFGESATATVTVSTQRVVLDIHKNEGVGIGKIHERGVLDVSGDAYVDGKLETTGSVTVDGNLNVRTSVIGNLMTYKNTNRSIAQINAVDNSSDRWNSEGRSSLKLRNNNNALSFIVGGTQNNRQSIIQGGHSEGPFAQHLSSLHINKLGGMTYIGAGLSVTGSKNAIHVTRDGFRATPAYEMAESFLGDIGSGKSDEKGIAKIYIDALFSDTINTEHEYHVFLQEHSSSRAWVKERNKDHFVVETETPNTSFSWELKAKRRGYENDRLKLDDVLQLSDISNMQELSGAPRELEKVEKTM